MSYESWTVVCPVWGLYRTYGAYLLIILPVWVSVSDYMTQQCSGCAIKYKCLFSQLVTLDQKSADQLLFSQSYCADSESS